MMIPNKYHLIIAIFPQPTITYKIDSNPFYFVYNRKILKYKF